MTVAEFAAQWAELSTTRSPETQRHSEEMIARFVREYAELPLGELMPIDAQRWAGLYPGHVRYLRAFFADAARLGLVASSPFEGVRCANAVTRHKNPPSPSELDRIAAEAAPLFRQFVRVATGTGLRLSEIARMRREDVQQVPLFRVRVVGKGGRPRTVGAFGEAREIVGDLCARRIGLLFVTASGGPWSRQSVSDAWRRCADAAGYPGSFHSTRHFFAGWALSNGVSEVDLAIQLGHMDRDGRANTELVRRVYGRPDPERSLERLDERLSG